jgi:hypothetical protein
MDSFGAGVLQVDVVLGAQEHAFAGRRVQVVQRVDHLPGAEHDARNPVPQRGQFRGREVIARAPVEIQITQIDQRLEHHGGARLRVAEIARHLRHRARLLRQLEVFEDLDGARR